MIRPFTPSAPPELCHGWFPQIHPSTKCVNPLDGFTAVKEEPKPQPKPEVWPQQDREDLAQVDPTSTKIKPTLTDWIVAGFTIVLAVVGLLQWQVLSKQSKTLSNQLEEMKQDQRAWLKVVPVDSQNYTYGSGEKITVKLRVTNIGKSVAKNVTGVFLSEKTINGQNPNLDLFGNGSGKLHSVLFPGDFFDVSVDSYASHYPRSERLTANKEFLDELTSGRSFITTHGEVLYEDIFGVPHWVHFCTWSSNDSRLQGTVMKCTEFNKVDDNH